MKQSINVIFLQRAYCIPADYLYLSASVSGTVRAHREKPYFKNYHWLDTDEDKNGDLTTMTLDCDSPWEEGQYHPDYNLLCLKDYADRQAFASIVSYFASKEEQDNMIEYVRQWANDNPMALDYEEIKAHTGLQLAKHHESIVIKFLRPSSRFYDFRGMTLEIPFDARYLACNDDGSIFSFKERPVRVDGLCGVGRQQVGWTARPFDDIHVVEMK